MWTALLGKKCIWCCNLPSAMIALNLRNNWSDWKCMEGEVVFWLLEATMAFEWRSRHFCGYLNWAASFLKIFLTWQKKSKKIACTLSPIQRNNVIFTTFTATSFVHSNQLRIPRQQMPLKFWKLFFCYDMLKKKIISRHSQSQNQHGPHIPSVKKQFHFCDSRSIRSCTPAITMPPKVWKTFSPVVFFYAPISTISRHFFFSSDCVTSSLRVLLTIELVPNFFPSCTVSVFYYPHPFLVSCV